MKKTKKVIKKMSRGRPKGLLNEQTAEWLKDNKITEDVYLKVLDKIRCK